MFKIKIHVLQLTFHIMGTTLYRDATYYFSLGNTLLPFPHSMRSVFLKRLYEWFYCLRDKRSSGKKSIKSFAYCVPRKKLNRWQYSVDRCRMFKQDKCLTAEWLLCAPKQLIQYMKRMYTIWTDERIILILIINLWI